MYGPCTVYKRDVYQWGTDADPVIISHGQFYQEQGKHTITVESDVHPNFINGSVRKLSNYRGIFLVLILCIIFEKLLKNRVTPLLEENMTKFQTGGVKNKGVVDNLFVLRDLIDHSKYLKKELWITFYDIEKCFDSLWLEDCINSLWHCGVDDDILYLIYLLNRKANIIVRIPFGNTQSFEICNLVKQGTVLGPILNNCSLDDICSEGHGHNMGTIQRSRLWNLWMT